MLYFFCASDVYICLKKYKSCYEQFCLLTYQLFVMGLQTLCNESQLLV